MQADREAEQRLGYLTETRTGWPVDAANLPDGAPRVTFRAILQGGELPAVAIVRTVETGGIALVTAPVWKVAYGSPTEAQRRCDWLAAREGRCVELGRAAAVFGPDYVTSAIELGIRVEDTKREQRRREDEEIAEVAREMAEEDRRKSLVITCHFKEAKGRFVVELRRGNSHVPFWSINFDEKWERDRFWDWFGWQKRRWPDLADFLATHERIDLDRMLLKEMLETERRVKREGLGAGGRRPLRFWRGDA